MIYKDLQAASLYVVMCRCTLIYNSCSTNDSTHNHARAVMDCWVGSKPKFNKFFNYGDNSWTFGNELLF